MPGGGDYKMNKIHFFTSGASDFLPLLTVEKIYSFYLQETFEPPALSEKEEGEWTEERTHNKTSTIKP